MVLDGPVSDKYLYVMNSLSNTPILANFGVVREGQSKNKLRVFL